ncbi:hypothetical protein AC231_14395 [Clostridium pasteurianum]|uniref:glycosyltransferase n=1 Tax=Clostridium pasteurianum TaxID=1501 RepID=UPI0009778F14|nr:glycosyltransferase [Clostridium pasteurianum]OMH21624.1 hypothetical protein AC231_14395 [Clostridium pasteurianum]
MKTCFCPYESKLNKYVEIIQDCLKLKNIEVYSIKSVLSNRKLFKEVSIYNFNWFENVDKSKIKMIPKIICKILFIKYLRIKKKKIIWTMHNKEPHNSKNNLLAQFMIKFMAVNSQKIVVLSNESKVTLKKFISEEEIEKKVKLIAHPNYLGSYKNSKVDDISNNNYLNLLFIGRVQPYKNIELLIDVSNSFYNKNVNFIIAGKPNTSEYGEMLKKSIKNKNIKTKFSFIEDEEMISLIKMSDAIILPYDIQSSLNSGTIMLAFSNKKTVISPLIGTLKDIKNENLYFTYEYSSQEEHKKS